MLKCPYCDSAISEFATSCPNCGKAINKEIVKKGLERQRVQKAQKHKLRELGKEKYLPFIITIVFAIVSLINIKLNNNVAMLIYILIWAGIISISFTTKIYQSNKGYILKNIQMVVDVRFIFMSLVVTFLAIKDMKVIPSIQMLLVSLIFITSFILCIRMGKNRADT